MVWLREQSNYTRYLKQTKILGTLAGAPQLKRQRRALTHLDNVIIVHFVYLATFLVPDDLGRIRTGRVGYSSFW